MHSEPPSPAPERRYVSEELEGLKKRELCVLILRQAARWPKGPGQKDPTETSLMRLTHAQLVEGLLAVENGFTTTAVHPRPASTQPTLNDPQPTPIHTPSTAPPVIAPPQNISSTFVNLSLSLFVHYTPESKLKRPSAADVVLSGMMTENPGPRALLIRAHDLLTSLQKTNAKITGGPVAVSHQHHARPEYPVLFAACFDPEKPECTQYNPEWLRVPETGLLSLEVRSLSEPESEQGDDSITMEEGAVDSKKLTKPKKGRASEPRERVVQMLMERLEGREGYRLLNACRNHPVDNSVIVDLWKFAAEFSGEFSGKRLLGIGHKAVTKLEVATALQYGYSWLKEAVRGHSLVEAYKEDQRVKDELEFKSPTGTSKGSTHLLRFLVDHGRQNK
ncbi:hypothetical protein V5O48_010476 [Marasmius crinis-equi]|uniref:Uncharacterized protein n=1 Tax=Marasmius crinis-equi TaxID=585013 RepID=A0ABR3F8A6_9AGAR